MRTIAANRLALVHRPLGTIAWRPRELVIRISGLPTNPDPAANTLAGKQHCERRVGTGPGQINPIAYTLFNYKLPNGQYMIPSANPNSVVGRNPQASTALNPAVQSALIEAFPEDAEVPGTALFLAHQAVANLDWNPNSSHSFSAKYYYQHDPTIAPYAYSRSRVFRSIWTPAAR